MKFNCQNIRYINIHSLIKAPSYFLILFMILIQAFLLPQELLSNLKWKIFGNLNAHRQLHSAVAISKTEVLVIGGYDNTNLNGDLPTCEIIDVLNDTIKPGPPMNFSRGYFATLVTKDTNIIVISGCNSGFDQLTSAVELFDKSTRSWRIIGYLEIARWQHCAEFLNDHEIIIVGGRLGDQTVINNIEIFNINTGQSRLVNPFPFPTSDAVCGTTSQSKIITLGGREAGTNSNRSKYIFEYDIINDKWNIIDSVRSQINMPTMIKLLDSRLLIIGGIFHDNPAIVSDEVYIENNGRFTNSGKVLTGRFRFPMVQYNNDSVLVIGGYYDYNSCTRKCDWYNITSNVASTAPDLNFARYNFAAVTLPDPYNPSKNVVLAIGGNDNQNHSLNSVEILMDSVFIIPPLIFNISSDCDNFYFTVSDSNLIDRVELTGFDNQNVKVSTIETLPASVVHVVVSLIDPKLNGYFTVTCTSNKTGLSVDISDTIYNNIYYLRVVSPIKNGSIDLGDTAINTVKCVDVEIRNEGFDDISIDSASLVTKSEFYIPAGQLPLTIPYGQQRTLRICFLPTKQGVFNDTLYLRDICDSIVIPIRGRGLADKPPLISDTSQDCFNYYFTVTDSYLIDLVELTGPNNKNVAISVVEPLPAMVVHVKVSLIDPRNNGYFNVTCYCNNTGLTTDISGTIHGDLTFLNVSFPAPPNVTFIVDTIVNATKCINLIIENTGNEYITVDSAMFYFNTEFSIPGNQLPMVIPPNQQKQLTICFSSGITGIFTDTLYLKNLCDTLFLPIHGLAYENKASQIIDTSFDCNNYYITVADSNYINRVELSGTKNVNVKITVIENLPSRLVHITITLIDPLENGYFTITVYCSASSKSVDFSGVIYSRPDYLIVLYPLDSGKVYVGKSEFGNLKCIKVLLQNIGAQELILDYVRLLDRKEFSIPQSQLPIIIPAGERQELELCYLPSALGEQWDTLKLNDLCDTLTIPVKAIGDTAFYSGMSGCNITIKVKTLGAWKNVVVSNPYPNPGNTIVNIDIQTDIDFENDFDCKFLDNIGNIISSATNIYQNKISVEGVQYRNYKVNFEIDKFASGAYFIQIISGEIKKILPYFILR